MCGNSAASGEDAQSYSLHKTAHLVEASPDTSFTATRLNNTTFRLVEDDQYIERPFIYVKSCPTVIVVIDTGCNSPRNPQLPVTGLRSFLETIPVNANQHKPLNPQGRLPYYIILSHCHFDHTGGLETFSGSPHNIYCSQSFLSELTETKLHQYSLRESLSLPALPLDLEKVTGVPDGHVLVDGNGVDLQLQLVHAPGHSADHMVVLDHGEHTAFLGDSAYEHSPLFYAYGGDLLLHCQTLHRLYCLLKGFEAPEGAETWIAACGHFSSGLPATSLLQRTRNFVLDVVEKRIPLQDQMSSPYQPNEELQFFVCDKLAMLCPASLLENQRTALLERSTIQHIPSRLFIHSAV